MPVVMIYMQFTNIHVAGWHGTERRVTGSSVSRSLTEFMENSMKIFLEFSLRFFAFHMVATDHLFLIEDSDSNHFTFTRADDKSQDWTRDIWKNLHNNKFISQLWVTYCHSKYIIFLKIDTYLSPIAVESGDPSRYFNCKTLTTTFNNLQCG